MPVTEPIDALKDIVAKRSLEWVFEEPDIVESLLLDYCERRSVGLHLLVSSLRAGIPQRLMAARQRNQREAAIGQARRQLETDLGLLPEKASWTVDAWLQILGEAGKSVPPGPLEDEQKEPPRPIVLKSYEERCQEIMKKAFDEGEPIHIVAKLLSPDDLRRGTAMAKAYWAGLSDAEREAIKKTRKQKGYGITPGKVLLIVLLLVTIPFVVAYPITWLFVYGIFPAMGFALHFVQDAWARVTAGDYVGGIPRLLGFLIVLYVISRIYGKLTATRSGR